MTATSPRGVVGVTVGVAMRLPPELRAESERADDFNPGAGAWDGAEARVLRAEVCLS